MAFTIENNQPSAGCIRWAGLHMQYYGVSYTITNGYSNSVYFYWTPTSPTVLVSSLVFPTLGPDDCLIFLNKSGTAVTVPTATVMDGDLIVPGSIMANAIAANTITGDKIHADTITANNMSIGAITAKSMAVDAVGAGVIAAGTITGDRIVADAITAREIAARCITANEILAGTISANEIAALTITAAKIAAGTITVTQLNSSVGTGLNISSNASITSKVSSTQVDTMINAIVIGGRNMVIGGDFESDTAETSTINSGVLSIDSTEHFLNNNSLKIVTNAASASSGGGVWCRNLTIGNVYTISLQIKSPTVDNVTVSAYSTVWANLGSVTSALAINTWKAIQLTVTATETSFLIGLINGSAKAITYYVDAVKAEHGTKVTDWTPSNEEIQDAIDAAQTTASNAETDASNAQSAADDAQDTGSSAQEALALVGDRVTKTEASISTNATSILSKVGSLEFETLSGLVSGNASEIAQFDDKIAFSVKTVSDNLKLSDSKIATINSHMTFDVDGLIIGQDNGLTDNLKVQIKNDEMNFLDNGQTVAKITGQQMDITRAKITTSMQVGQHMIETYSDDITLIRWVGGAV